MWKVTKDNSHMLSNFKWSKGGYQWTNKEVVDWLVTFFLGGKNSSKCKEKGWQKPFIKQNGVKLVMFAPMCAW